jgi:RNA polymerase sigma-70 factor (ECF subfamily)
MKSLKEEFLDILSSYQGILHKVALIYFPSKPDREEVFQEITYQLWKSFPDLQNRNSVGSWIYAVSINTSISILRKKSRMEYRDHLPETIDTADSFEEMVLHDQLKELLQAIYRLNDIDKSMMLLYLDERTYEEISEILGISRSNVGVRINRAKEFLRIHLNHLNYGK